MSSAISSLARISDTTTSREQRLVAMRSFAETLRWDSSYDVLGSFGVDGVVGHLVVEPGLENSATISFLTGQNRAADLGPAQLRALLTISYNNLIEWHIFVSERDVRWVNNLVDRRDVDTSDRLYPLNGRDFSKYLSASHLDELTSTNGLRRSLKACDDAVIDVVSLWRRLLKGDYPSLTNRNISARTE